MYLFTFREVIIQKCIRRSKNKYGNAIIQEKVNESCHSCRGIRYQNQ